MAQSPAKAAESLAKQSPLPFFTTNQAVAELLEAMFYRFKGANPDLDPKLEAAFEARFGYKMLDQVDGDRIAAFYFEGPSGHGKTSGFEAAAKEFCKLMELNFVMPREGQEVGERDFVYNVISVGGATHKMDFDGMIAREKDSAGKNYMTHVPGWKMLKAASAAYAMILYDDFPTSSHQVQHGLLDMSLEGSNSSINFNKDGGRAKAGSSSVFVGFCGNIGTKDGNKVQQITAATANRIWRAHVEDTPTDWANRTIRTFNDTIGDAHMSAFVRAHEDFFSLPPTDGAKGQFPSPRSLTTATSYLRRRWHEAVSKGGSFGENKESHAVVSRMQRGLEGFLGKETAQRIAAFYTALITSAEPLAEKAIMKGEVDVEEIRKRMNDGNDTRGLDFAYSFASSLAQKLTIRVADIYPSEPGGKKSRGKADQKQEFNKALTNFGRALCQLSPSVASYCVDSMFKRLASVRPEFFEILANHSVTPKMTLLDDFGGTILNEELNEYLTEEMKETLLDSLSAMNKHLASGGAGLKAALGSSIS